MKIRLFVYAIAVLCVEMLPARAAELKLLFPLTEHFPAVKSKTAAMPESRIVYQTNERIDLAVARTASADLAPGELRLSLEGADGSRLTFSFPARAAAAKDGAARATEHCCLDARLLRPGRYRLRVEADGASAESPLEIYSHVRRSSFKTVNWGGRAKGPALWHEGEQSLGYNVFLGRTQDDPTYLLRAGVDFMNLCTMSGGHQMDLRSECDWSDPYVTRAGTMRVAHQALVDRQRGNTIGVHFYDEPGLTWGLDPVTQQRGPHTVPAQHRAYAAAFGRAPIDYQHVDLGHAGDLAEWDHWARFKLGILDAAWKQAQFGVSQVRADYLSANQSQYGWSAFSDGYYFNVQRSLPITLGHGGYDDFGPGYFNPSYFLELARAHDLGKDCWYLPTWYGATSGDTFRLEQYLAFQTGLQGLMTPPELDPAAPAKVRAAQAVVESNHLLGRLGTVLTTMPVTRPSVAMLYSLSQAIHTQAGDRTLNYAHAMPQGRGLPFTYLAGKLTQQQFLPVLDEDVLDGTLAANHKAVILTGLDYLDPRVIAALEQFAAAGGRVLMTGDCTVAVKGAVKLPVIGALPNAGKIAVLTAYQTTLRERMARPMAELKAVRDELANAQRDLQAAETPAKKLRAEFEKLDNRARKAAQGKNQEQAAKYRAEAEAKQKDLQTVEAQLAARQAVVAEKKTALEPKLPPVQAIQEEMNAAQKSLRELQGVNAYFQGATPLAQAIRAELEKAGIGPIFQCDVPTIVATRQAAADIEYLFAVNATYDDEAGMPNGVKAVTATIALPADGRPVYDAIRGGLDPALAEKDGRLSGRYRFGPGQMHVFARSARPIGGVQVHTPLVVREMAGRQEPIRLQIAATLMDDRGQVLSGSAPLEIRVIDPLGFTRFELYRATRLGSYQETLPLAANDPAGQWTILVRELLANHEGSGAFGYAPSSRAGTLAGQPHRAVAFGNDLDQAFRFAQTHHDVTIVAGSSPFDAAAAERLVSTLAPWGIRCRVMDLAEAAKARTLSEEEAATWTGLVYAGRGQIKAGADNLPALAGFAVQGPVILLGNPEDHPIIKFLQEQRFLPYQPNPQEFPGPGRGMLAWQRDGVGRGQESITLIAYDAAGMNEAAGTFQEAMMGREPLTAWLLPAADSLAPAVRVPDAQPALAPQWTACLPDRIEALHLAGQEIAALSHDGTLTTLNIDGKVRSSQVLAGETLDQARKAPAAAPAIALATQPYERPDRMVKLAVAGGELVAVAYWGGTVSVFDGNGTLKATHDFRQDITALAWCGSQLIAGDADGRVRAVKLP
jgi:hypothetical protein